MFSSCVCPSGWKSEYVNSYIPTQSPEEDWSDHMQTHQADSPLYVWPVVWSADLHLLIKSMVIHDTECPYWDQVSLNNTNQPTNLICVRSRFTSLFQLHLARFWLLLTRFSLMVARYKSTAIDYSGNAVTSNIVDLSICTCGIKMREVNCKISIRLQIINLTVNLIK